MIKGHCLHRLPVLGGMLQDLVARHDATLLIEHDKAPKFHLRSALVSRDGSCMWLKQAEHLLARGHLLPLQPARVWAITRLTSGSSCPEGFSSLLRCTTGAAKPAARSRAVAGPAASHATQAGRAPARCPPTARCRWDGGWSSAHTWRPAAACPPWSHALVSLIAPPDRPAHALSPGATSAPNATAYWHLVTHGTSLGRTNAAPGCP